MSTKALIGILLAGTTGILVYLFVHLSGENGVVIKAPQAEACVKGEPCLRDMKFVDVAGTTYTPESLKGKVVVVNFWATWCHPCQKEIPDLSKAYDRYKSNGVVVLGIMTDNPTNAELLNFQSDYEMTYPIVRASSDIMVSFNYPQALPTTFVFNKAGAKVYSHVGPLSEAALVSQLDQYVKEK